MMNYEQAKEASKHNPAGVMKVLEGLEWECKKCEGNGWRAGGVLGAGTKYKCDKCNGKGKLYYSWTPQVGEFYFSKKCPRPKLVTEPDLISLSSEITPILEWEVIEEVLEKAGYSIDVDKYDEAGRTYEVELDTELQHLLRTKAKSRTRAVYDAVLALGEELK